MLGTIGAVLGYAIGFLVGTASGEGPLRIQTAWALFNPGLLLAVLFVAPLSATLASWPPAVLAARQDPAEVLREE